MAQDLCVEVRGQFTRVGSLYFVRTRNRTKILRLDKCHLYKFLKAHMKNRRKKKCHSEVWESHFTYSVNALSIERRTVTVLSTPARAGSSLGGGFVTHTAFAWAAPKCVQWWTPWPGSESGAHPNHFHFTSAENLHGGNQHSHTATCRVSPQRLLRLRDL